MKEDALLDLRFIAIKELIKNVKAVGSLHPRETVEFMILGVGTKQKKNSGELLISKIIFYKLVSTPSKCIRKIVQVTGDLCG